ncbi:hypothetical protein EV401DRAFT_2081596 [Pisolithus croceorrhizus]|nr:hypothetical protein EV401DRAFT_2081596 [Pisolithus croceorrhizus]
MPHIEATSDQKRCPPSNPASIAAINICLKVSNSTRRAVRRKSSTSGNERSMIGHTSYICHLLAKAAKEAAIAKSLLLAHPGAGSSDSTVAVIPVPPTQPSVPPSQSITRSPTAFTFNEDDILMGTASPSGSNMLDPDFNVSIAASAASHSTKYPCDFKTEFHPHSKCSTLYQSFEDFGQQNPEHVVALDSEPWCPFASEGDYIFAMITVEAGLTSTQVDSLHTLVHHIRKGIASVMLVNNAGLHATLDRAASQLTPFSKLKITAPYKGEDMMFQVHIRPLWDWALDLLQNPSLTLHFVWDAQQLFKHDGKKYECFYTEPWMGTHWWDIQSQLPTHAKNAAPFTFIIYADKMQLSSHGTVKGYPVVVCCANLPIHICNGEQYGGGCIVGWLPIVPELVKEERKTGYANFKHAVWHEAFFKLLEKVDKLWDLSKTYEMHTIQQHKEALAIYEDKKSAGKKKLKSLGLHPIKNVFWSVEHSELEQAASFEPLHSLHGGLGGKHMHKELKIVVSELGHDFETKLEEQVSAFSHWHGLMHFDTVIHVTFSDGNKIKGVVHNYSAQPNEKMHGPLKDAYQDCSNGKDFAGQFIQACINAENGLTNLVSDGGNSEDDCEMFEGNTKLGAPQQSTSLSDVEVSHVDDRAFDRFCQKLESFLNTCLPTYRYPLDKWIWLQGMHIGPGVSVSGGQLQYDSAIIQLLETKIAFVQLIFFFTCKVPVLNETFQFALIQPLTAWVGVCRIDQDFDLIQVKALSHAVSMFIPVKSIIHGALLYPDPSHHGKFLVVEHINGDMFLWMKEWTQTCCQVAATADHLSSSDSDEMPTETQSNSSGSDTSDMDNNASNLKELQQWHRVMCEPPPDASAAQLCAIHPISI